MFVRPEAFAELSKPDEIEYSESSLLFEDIEKSLGRKLTEQEKELMTTDIAENIDTIERI